MIQETLSADVNGLLPGETLDPATGEITTVVTDSPAVPMVQQSLMLPVKNKLVPLTDRDSCIDAIDYLIELDRSIEIAKKTLRQAIQNMTKPGEGNTRHVRHSDGRDAVVTMPKDSWDDAALKKIWQAYGEFNIHDDPVIAEARLALRDEFLRVDKVAVNLTPFKKALNTEGNEEFKLFIARLQTCQIAAMGTASVKIEPAKADKSDKKNGKAAKNIVDAESVKAVAEDGNAAMNFDDV